MANVKISQLPAASSVSAGASALPMQTGATTYKATPNQIVKEVLKAPGDIGLETPGTGTFSSLLVVGSADINGTLIPASSTLVATSGAQTLVNKTLNLANNTITGTIAQFNTACSDADFVSTSGSATLTNKTVNLANNTVTGTISQFNTACSDADFATIAGAESLSNKAIQSSCSLVNPQVASGNGFVDANFNEYLRFSSVASAVNEVTVTNAATTGSPTLSATGSDANINLALTAKGTGVVVANDLYSSKRVRSISDTAGVGYGTGAGGSVTQTANRTNPVTINKICGEIITVSATATAGAFVIFKVNNSTVAATDTVIVNLKDTILSGNYIINATDVTNGSFYIQTYTPVAVIGSEALNINFSVIKSVAA